MSALCHFPSPCHRSLSKLLSNSKSQGPLHSYVLVTSSSPNPNISSVGSQTRRRSSSFSIKASTAAFVPLEHTESTTLGDITRSDFPILRQKVNGRDLVYMDNAATSQKPNFVLNALKEYYEYSNSNVHRGVHYLRFSLQLQNITVLLSHGKLLLKKRVSLKYIDLTTGEVPDIEQLKNSLSNKTKLVVIHHVSNTLGSVLPIEDIVIWSHEVGARVLLDACQSVPHMVVDVQKLNVDFLAASSHKMCGPTGIGFLYGKIDLLSSMPPFLGGGEMISEVFQDYSTYAEPPSRCLRVKAP